MKPSHPLTEESVKIARALAPYKRDKSMFLAIQLGMIHPTWETTEYGDVYLTDDQGLVLFIVYNRDGKRGFRALEDLGGSKARWTDRFGTAAALLKRYGVDP